VVGRAGEDSVAGAPTGQLANAALPWWETEVRVGQPMMIKVTRRSSARMHGLANDSAA